MTDAHRIVLRRSIPLWGGAGAVFGFILFASTRQDPDLIRAALAVTAVYAGIGVAFGIWAGRTVARAPLVARPGRRAYRSRSR